MKIIIWFFCILTASILQTLLRSIHFFGGFQAIILFALMWYSASFLCKAWYKKHPPQLPATDYVNENTIRRNTLYHNQRPDNDDFGYTALNPICTSTINASDIYLSRLRTLNNEELFWIRKGSICEKNCNGVENVNIDIYQLYLNWDPYKEIYICPYGHNSSYVPKGLILDKNDTPDTGKRNIIHLAKGEEMTPEDYIRFMKFMFKTRKYEKQNRASNEKQTDTLTICHNCGQVITTETFSTTPSPEMEERYKIGKIMGCDINQLSVIDNLAISTIIAIDTIKRQDKDSILCHSPLACCDTILFSSFLLRIMCMCHAKNKDRFITYSNNYLNSIKIATGKIYMPLSNKYNMMFNNRMTHYDHVFMSKNNSDDGIAAIFEEFETILIMDKINNTYEPIFENTPIPIIGILDKVKYHIDIKCYFEELPLLVSPYLKQAQNFFQL